MSFHRAATHLSYDVRVYKQGFSSLSKVSVEGTVEIVTFEPSYAICRKYRGFSGEHQPLLLAFWTKTADRKLLV